MKCPRCAAIPRAAVAQCPGCGFSIAQLDRALRPPSTLAGPLDDEASVLAPADHAALTRLLIEAAERSGGRWLVATRASTAPVSPAEYAFWLFNRRGLASSNGEGLLVLLALREQRIETEVSTGWEDRAGDLVTGRILDREVLPLLQERDYAGALRAAVVALATLVAGERA